MAFSRHALIVGAVALLLSQFLLRLPQSSPKPLYQALGVPETASATEIKSAYDRLRITWSSAGEHPERTARDKLIESQHAYDILSDESRRRNYDLFLLDELAVAVEEAKKQLARTGGDGQLQLPVWQVESAMELPLESATATLTSQNFGKLVLESNDTWVIQVYSEASPASRRFGGKWERVAQLMDGVAKLGCVEVGQLPLTVLLAEKTLASKQPFFRSGLPEVVVFTSSCRRFDCLVRYRGEHTVDAMVEWLSTTVLKLPRILYYSSKTLMKDIIQGSGPHKVKVIGFSSTGERAAPYVRQAAKQYWEYVAFAMVLWQEPNATFWEARVGVESAPALVFVKDPGLKPVIHHGLLTSEAFGRLMEAHKTFELPQLRSISAGALGCDARGYSMVGENATTWYCVIVAGRTGLPLNQMRGVVRGVLQNLTRTELPPEVPHHLLAAEAVQSKRLSLSWLDGEMQKDFCYFYLHSPTMFEACGPRRYGEVEDVPKLFLVRYQRKLLTPEEEERQERNKVLRARNLWLALQGDDDDNVASQLVSKYNGSTEIGDIVLWISQMVYEGDNNHLPSFSGKMPALVVEEKLPYWARTQEAVADGQSKIAENAQLLYRTFLQYNENMKLLPVLAFLAIFFGSQILLRRKGSHAVSQVVEPPKDDVVGGT